ncbi:3-deoxy-manno-octulosonate cytidylyltransferase, partial [Leptospira gomenensis]
IEESIKPMVSDESLQVLNLMSELKTREEHEDPNEVKVVVDLKSFAVYFSREPIPSWKKGAKNVPMLKQVCIIPFRRDFLLKFNELEPTPLEIIESVDMLRVLEHGYRVKMVHTDAVSYSVDTEADRVNVEKHMLHDSIRKSYS